MVGLRVYFWLEVHQLVLHNLLEHWRGLILCLLSKAQYLKITKKMSHVNSSRDLLAKQKCSTVAKWDFFDDFQTLCRAALPGKCFVDTLGEVQCRIGYVCDTVLSTAEWGRRNIVCITGGISSIPIVSHCLRRRWWAVVIATTVSIAVWE